MYKLKRPKRILAIDPGSKYWGWCLFKDNELYDYGVKVLKTKGTSKQRLREAKKVFTTLFENYTPNVFVVEKPFFFWSNQSKLLNKIIELMKSTAKKEKIKVYEFSPRTVRKCVLGDGNGTKQDMAKVLVTKFPDLAVLLNQNKKYQQRYWGHCFDAVGLGACWN